MISKPAPTVPLRNGADLPLLGLGTWPLNDAEAADTVATAIDAGYRLIDTAENYRNEAGVGEGIHRSGIERNELFLTTKFNKEWHGHDGARRAFSNSSRLLGVDYIDLLLVHWPNPDEGRYVEAVEGIAALVDEGLVRAVGTSNFKPSHLQRVLDAGVIPEVNQIQLDPRRTRQDVRAFHARHSIVTEAWSPLGPRSNLLEMPPITSLAEQYGKFPAQIVLRWHVQQGVVAIPKSSHPGRLSQNIDIFDFELTPRELDSISALDTGESEITDSDIFGH